MIAHTQERRPTAEAVNTPLRLGQVSSPTSGVTNVNRDVVLGATVDDEAALLALEYHAEVVRLVREAFPDEPALLPWELRSMQAQRSYLMTPAMLAACFIRERTRKNLAAYEAEEAERERKRIDDGPRDCSPMLTVFNDGSF
jgi:hypothetical protein